MRDKIWQSSNRSNVPVKIFYAPSHRQRLTVTDPAQPLQNFKFDPNEKAFNSDVQYRSMAAMPQLPSLRISIAQLVSFRIR